MPRMTRQPRIDRTCVVCGGLFSVTATQMSRTGAKYCGYVCYDKARQHHEWTPDTYRVHQAQTMRDWREANPELAKAAQERAMKIRGGKQNRLLRSDALAAYGGKCVCCGETTYEFLCIDHVGGGGSQHRKSIGVSNIYPWLAKQGYPPGFRVLCHNCNMADGFYGECPHQAGTTLPSTESGI